MSAPDLVLHLGAPKCGSSALQAALTARPDHAATGDRAALRYVAGERRKTRVALISGPALRKQGARSPYQYRCWPNVGPRADPAPLFAAIRQALDRGRRGAYVPILSCEGWIAHPERFAAALADMGHPRVDAVAYLRPPLEWINAAWWQWGVWTVRSLDAWLDLGTMTYRFGALLAHWAAIPNLRLHVRPARPDAVADFATLCGLDLPPAQTGNGAVPPSLIGFFLRNRRFRPTPHAAASEFVYQRWCPPTAEPRPWAVLARHVHRLRPHVAETRAQIAPLLDEAGRAALFADPRWTHEAPYHPAILAGPSRLHHAETLPGLDAALRAGVARVAGRRGAAIPALPAPPPPGAGVEQWDPVLAQLFEALLAQDAAWRLGPVRGLAEALYGRFRTG